MLPTSAGVEPATSWSPVGQRIQLNHRGRHIFFLFLYKNKKQNNKKQLLLIFQLGAFLEVNFLFLAWVELSWHSQQSYRDCLDAMVENWSSLIWCLIVVSCPPHTDIIPLLVIFDTSANSPIFSSKSRKPMNKATSSNFRNSWARTQLRIKLHNLLIQRQTFQQSHSMSIFLFQKPRE